MKVNVPTLPSFFHVTSEVSLNSYPPPDFFISTSRVKLIVKSDVANRIRTHAPKLHWILSPAPYPLGHGNCLVNALVLNIIKLTLDFFAKWCFGKYEATETCFYWGLKCRCRNISVIHRQEVSLQFCFDVSTTLISLG